MTWLSPLNPISILSIEDSVTLSRIINQWYTEKKVCWINKIEVSRGATLICCQLNMIRNWISYFMDWIQKHNEKMYSLNYVHCSLNNIWTDWHWIYLWTTVTNWLKISVLLTTPYFNLKILPLELNKFYVNMTPFVYWNLCYGSSK